LTITRKRGIHDRPTRTARVAPASGVEVERIR